MKHLMLPVWAAFLLGSPTSRAADSDEAGTNLAPIAVVSTSFVSEGDKLAAVQRNDDPASSEVLPGDQYDTVGGGGEQWVQYDFSKFQEISACEVYWADDGRRIHAPKQFTVEYWKSGKWERIARPEAPLLELNKYNRISFPPVNTKKIRLETTPDRGFVGIKRLKVLGRQSMEQPNEAPVVSIGPGYYTILPGKILLAGSVTDEDPSVLACSWTKESGPGEVKFEKPSAAITYATTTTPGKYVFQLKATDGKLASEATTTVNVYPAGPFFGNPIVPGMFPDPHILFDNGKFYIFATSMENQAGAYGRASVWVSEDFVNWNMQLNNWPVYGQFNGDIWAPDILKKDKKYYQFITRSGGYDTWIAVADSPAGPWKNLREDNTPIVSGGGKAGRIVAAYNMDSQPFMDDDGQVYMYWGWSESMAAKLTPDLKDIDGEVHFLKGTKWLPSSGDIPQWLMVDLGEPTEITRTKSSPEFKHISYGYRIETSNDSTNWVVFADRTANRTELPGDGYVDQGKAKARYVRITMTFCGGSWAGLYDFSVFSGDQLVSLNKPATASSVRGPGAEPRNAVDGSNGPYLSDFVEGSYMIKRNGTYYLLYSTGALHDGSYSVHYAMGQQPFGPFVTPTNNVVIKMNEDQTTKGPGHNSVLKFKGQYYLVYHQHNQPHEEAGGVFRQACADKMEFNADGTIKQVVPTQFGVGALQPYQDPGVDVARGKYAAASSFQKAAYAPEYALDHNYASKWRAASNVYPQWLSVDLNGTFNVSNMETSFEYPTLSYKYKIETSLNGKDWDLYADRTADFPVAVSPQKDRKSAKAAFVRITITGCQRPENSAGIYAFKVFGKAP